MIKATWEGAYYVSKLVVHTTATATKNCI